MQELDTVILTIGIHQYGLILGDIGTIVLVYDRSRAYEVEFTTLSGETIAVVTLTPDQFRVSSRDEIAHARLIQAT